MERKRKHIPNEYETILGTKRRKQRYSAYKFAIDTRKYEISMFWQRSQLFWTFVAIAFSGYFVVIGISNQIIIEVLISIIGFVFSIIWYFSCRGSKYWQENWESHIDELENEFSGSIYKVIKNPNKYQKRKLTEAYPMSVSRLNILLSMFVTLIWYILLNFSLIRFFAETDIKTMVIIVVSTLFLSCIVVCIIYKFGRTNIRIDRNKEAQFINRSE